MAQGKGSRARNRLRRKKEKAAIRAARAALYASQAVAGKRKGRGERQRRKSLASHPFGFCGNPGCSKCFIESSHGVHKR